MHFSATRTQPEGGRHFWFAAILGMVALLAGCNGKDVSIRDFQSSDAVQTADVKTGWSGKIKRKWSGSTEPTLSGKNGSEQEPDTDYGAPGGDPKEPGPDSGPVISPGLVASPEPDASEVVDNSDTAGDSDLADNSDSPDYSDPTDNYDPISKPAEPLPTPPQKLTWHPPLTREDGTSLYPGEIAGYKIYYKKAHLNEFRLVPLNDPTDTDLSLDSFTPGVYHFAISTIDVNGLESRRSAVVKVNVT